MMTRSITIILIIFIIVSTIFAGENRPIADIVVDKTGKGDYTSLTDAINELPMLNYRRVVILIRNGVYEEHIRITQNYITLLGENRDSTIIRYPLLRSDWDQNPDAIGPGVINIFADDLILENLTVENSQPEIGPHAFAVYGYGTRIIINNCNIFSKGGDTVALWNYKDGMYYHSNCSFTGSVDFVCPRGWCFIRDSKFYEYKKTAAIWHDGHYDPNQKFVLKNCAFDGVPGFELGRHHYQAQFILIDFMFSENMADKPIYMNKYEDDEKNNPDILGERNYFNNSVKSGESFQWLENNFRNTEDLPDVSNINPDWTFDGMWNPENEEPLIIEKFSIQNNTVILFFKEIVSLRGNPVLTRSDGLQLQARQYRFNDVNNLIFDISNKNEKNLSGKYRITNGQILASQAYVIERQLENPVIIP